MCGTAWGTRVRPQAELAAAGRESDERRDATSGGMCVCAYMCVREQRRPHACRTLRICRSPFVPSRPSTLPPPSPPPPPEHMQRSPVPHGPFWVAHTQRQDALLLRLRTQASLPAPAARSGGYRMIGAPALKAYTSRNLTNRLRETD